MSQQQPPLSTLGRFSRHFLPLAPRLSAGGCTGVIRLATCSQSLAYSGRLSARQHSGVTAIVQVFRTFVGPQLAGQRPAAADQPASYTSVCSAISRASSTSTPKYRTVLSSLVCPSSNCTARRVFVRR